MLVQFRKWKCNVVKSRYVDNKNTALQLVSGGEPIAIATVNLGWLLPEDQAYIKDYSENEGMLKALQDSGIVIAILGYEQSGYVTIPLCRIDLSKVSEAYVDD